MKTQELDDLKRHAHILGTKTVPVYEEITPKEDILRLVEEVERLTYLLICCGDDAEAGIYSAENEYTKNLFLKIYQRCGQWVSKEEKHHE